MKNRTSLFYFLTIILCLGTTSMSYGQAVVSVSPSSVASPAAGSTLKVNIQISNGHSVAGYEFTVESDTSALAYVSAANGTYLPSDAFAPAAQVSGNSVRLTAVAGRAATQSSGTLVTVTFRVVAAKASTLRLRKVLLTDVAGKNLAVRAVNGEVRHSGCEAWDVNEDGQVNVSDLVLVAENLGSHWPTNPRVDVSGDGQVNVSDLALVVRHLGEESSCIGTPAPPLPEGMVLIPAGQFQMGSNDDEAQDEQPVHTVHIDAFFMDEHEVTNLEYKEFLLENPRWQKSRIDNRFHNGDYLKHWSGNNYPSGKANHPVTYVSWYAAMAYAEWAGKRLPTEAEWEYAARGGLAGLKYPSGNTISTRQANYKNHVGDTTPVGRYAANGYGLYDMAGNVWEWCLDEYDADFYFVSRNSRNPISGARAIQWILDNFTSIPTNSSRVLRGGSWTNDARSLRVSARYGNSPTISPAVANLGFRCARGTVTP